MAVRDKELEDRIEEVGNKLTNPPSDVQLLLQLLDRAENLLSRVEQCPAQTMHDALQLSTKALVTRDFLRHSDLDVKIAVASCLSEITRITAPDAPYDDDLMKEIFGLIVGAFKDLDDMSSRSFSKRVSILETVAKVRSCVLMLDLECDDLILDMFHHFLKTIRPKHSDTVFSSMETVMSLVIEESEIISAKLLSCLLDSLKLDEKNVMSSSKKLAEKVLANCALKLKPYIIEAFKGTCAPLSDYSKFVAAVCQGNLGTLQNEMNSFGETQAGDSKLSDRTLCDEPPQGSAKQEHEILLGKSVADADGNSKIVTSNGTIQIGNGDSIASDQKVDFSQSIVQLRDVDGSILGDSDNLGLGAAKLDGGRKGRKRKALVKLVVNNDQKQVDKEKEAPTSTGKRKGRSKEVDLSQADGLSFKEVQTAARSKSRMKSKPEPEPELGSTPGLADVSSSVPLDTPNEHDGIHSRKSRPHRSKKPPGKRNATDKAAVNDSSGAFGHGGLLESSQVTSGEIPTRDLTSKNSESINESERNLSKCSASKSSTHVEDEKTISTATLDSERKRKRHRGGSGSQRETKGANSSGQKKSAGAKQKKGGIQHVDEEDKEVKLKELVSSRKSAMKDSIKDQSLLKNVGKSNIQKNAQAKEETIGTPKRRKSNDKLVGTNIRVWWPDDERFYDGVIDSFDRSTRKHKILYDDGDVEVLLLKNETWEFIEAETKTDGENNTAEIIASDVKNKKQKGRGGDTATDKTKTDLPINSTPDSTIKFESNDKLSKRKGRRSVKIVGEETPKKSSSRRVKSTNIPDKTLKDNNQRAETTNKSDCEKPAQSTKTDPSKSVDKIDNDKSKSKDMVHTDTPKIRLKSKGISSKSSGKSKNVGAKSKTKSKDTHNSGVKSKDEDSSRTKPSTESNQKRSGKSAKGSGQKARGGSTPKINPNSNANDMSKSDPPKAEDAEARSTSGKKRKRGKHGR